MKKKPDCKALTRPVQDRALRSPNEPRADRPDPTKRRPGSLSRSILGALLLCLTSVSASASITVTGLLSQITSEALETYITFTPSADILLLNSGLSAGPAKTVFATNGAFSQVLNPGTYLVRLPRVGGRNAFTIGVPHGTSTENITNLIAAPWTYEQFVNTVSSNGVDPATVLAIMSTNASGSSTWATNLNAPGGVSEILVSDAIADSVTSHADFSYEQSGSVATLNVGAVWDLGNPVARRGEIAIRDGVGDVNVSISATNGTVYFPDRITLKEGTSFALVDGYHHPLLNAQQHSVAEPIYYWGGHSLAAQAWLVGSYEEGKTNGRFSFLVGELGISWNIGRSTNAGNDVGFLAASPSTNVAAFMSGASGPELRAALSYRRDDDKNIIGGVSRGTIIAGSNALVAVGNHTLLVSSNGIVFTNLFSELSFNGVQQFSLFPTADYFHMTNYTTVATNQFRSGANNGYMTNLVAGMYRIGYDIALVGDEIGNGSYFAAIYTNDVVAAGTVGIYTVDAGYATTMMRSRVLYLPANTGISLRMKAGVADLTPAYDINLWARQQ